MKACALAVLAVVALAVGGCVGSEPPAAGTSLKPTGITVVGARADMPAVVVDGQGSAWIDGPLMLARFDPRTSRTTTWDAGNDLVFSSIRAMAGARAGGVWLADGRHVRRFDGNRFVVDLTVPESVLPRSSEGIAGLAEDGDALWITDDGEVTARYADGQWTRLAEGRGGPLAVDARGMQWAGDRTYPGPTYGLWRFDGSIWTRPAQQATGYPVADIAGIAPAVGGGVWVLAGREGPATLHRFDGATWTVWQVPSSVGFALGNDLLTVAPDGRVWVAGMKGVARFGLDHRWRTFGPADGLPAADAAEGSQQSVAVAGDTVLVDTAEGTYRLAGSRFEQVIRPIPGPDVGLSGAILAVSRDEAWVHVTGPLDSNGTTARSGWWRYRRGEWAPVGPQASEGIGFTEPVLASDGAAWVITRDGLERVEGDSWRVMSTDVGHWQQPAAGPNGTVWFLEGRDTTAGPASSRRLVGLDAAGLRTVLPLPPLQAHRLAAGPDGTVWATNGGYAPPALAHWDGSWHTVPMPSPSSPGISDLLATSDGALWIAAGTLYRYAGGHWTSFDHSAWKLAQTQEGLVCVTPGVACFHATGLALESLPGVELGAIDIAPDDTAWVLGEQLARLPEGMTPGTVRTAAGL